MSAYGLGICLFRKIEIFYRTVTSLSIACQKAEISSGLICVTVLENSRF